MVMPATRESIRWTLRAGGSASSTHQVSAMGGHFMFDDDQQTPNTLSCAFEFDGWANTRCSNSRCAWFVSTNHEAGNRHTRLRFAIPGFMGAPKANEKLPTESGTVGDISTVKGYMAIDNEDAGEGSRTERGWAANRFLTSRHARGKHWLIS